MPEAKPRRQRAAGKTAAQQIRGATSRAPTHQPAASSSSASSSASRTGQKRPRSSSSAQPSLGWRPKKTGRMSKLEKGRLVVLSEMEMPTPKELQRWDSASQCAFYSLRRGYWGKQKVSVCLAKCRERDLHDGGLVDELRARLLRHDVGECIGTDNTSSDLQQLFNVERIQKHRSKDGARQFFVRWEGYSPQHDSWEPEELICQTAAYKGYMREQARREKQARQGGASSSNGRQALGAVRQPTAGRGGGRGGGLPGASSKRLHSTQLAMAESRDSGSSGSDSDSSDEERTAAKRAASGDSILPFLPNDSYLERSSRNVRKHAWLGKVPRDVATAPVRRATQKESEQRAEGYRSSFPQWQHTMSGGFNLLFYGYGSKRLLLETFATEACKDGTVIVVKGFLPSTTPKKILQVITDKVLGQQETFRSLQQHCAYIEKELGGQAKQLDDEERQRAAAATASASAASAAGAGAAAAAGGADGGSSAGASSANAAEPSGAPNAAAVAGGASASDGASASGGAAPAAAGSFEPGKPWTSSDYDAAVQRSILQHDLKPRARHANYSVAAAASESAGRERRPPRKRKLYLLVHNIDGAGLRSQQAQEVLCFLAGLPEVSVIASVDNIHATLLWDNTQHCNYTRFNWAWCEAATYASYDIEAMHLSDDHSTANVSGRIRGAAVVLSNLTENTRNVFKLLAKQQIAADGNFRGIRYHEFYRQSKRAFFTSSEDNFKTLLRELSDHKIITQASDVVRIAFTPAQIKEVMSSQ